MTVSSAGKCLNVHYPDSDGFYPGFNEEFYTIWMAYQMACGGQPLGTCKNREIERMWLAWQGRRMHPNIQYEGLPLLTTWSSYIMHLNFYLVHPFNSDSIYWSFFQSQWKADRAFYESSVYYAGGHRYG